MKFNYKGYTLSYDYIQQVWLIYNDGEFIDGYGSIVEVKKTIDNWVKE